MDLGYLLVALLFFFLLAAFTLTALSSALRRIHKRGAQRELEALEGAFFYRKLHHHLFPKGGEQEDEYETLFFATLSGQSIARLGYVAAALLLAITLFFDQNKVILTLLSILFIFLSFLIIDYLPRIWGTRHPIAILRLCAPLASFFLCLFLPLTLLFLAILKLFTKTVYFDHLQEPVTQAKQEIIDIIQEANLSANLDANDKKLITSVLKYREHIVREVMVPRVEVFSLSADTSIKEASKALDEEGYSRIPVWRNSVDDVIGILMYKDVQQKYMEYEQNGNDPAILDAPIESIAKPPLFTPETKRISTMLQEFRKKQMHLAIVVDEYGGTAGIVTIEDILEQIVGEIADEYDDEEELVTAQSDGAWIVDGRMNILDAEEQLGIEFPQEGDYDTINGYIHYYAGAIPSKGYTVKTDTFEIEVLRSNERFVEKVRIRTF